jgi:2-haloacid dehalogenase
MSKYQLIIFDADDTLFNFKLCEKAAMENTFKELGIHYNLETIKVYSKINDDLWKKHEKNQMTQEEVRIERFVQLNEYLKSNINPQKFNEVYTHHLAKTGIEFTESFDVLKKLHENGYKICILTNGVNEVQRSRLSRCSFKEYIDFIVVSSQAGSNKPNKEIFEYMEKVTGFSDKSKMLIVGDSLTSDIKGGINYGIDTCWINRSNKSAFDIKARYEIHNLEELFLIF